MEFTTTNQNKLNLAKDFLQKKKAGLLLLLHLPSHQTSVVQARFQTLNCIIQYPEWSSQLL